MSRLRIAVIGGPQYDQIDVALAAYTAFHGVAVDVVFRGDHVTLNQHLAEHLADPTARPYDLVSTHSKYAPAQAEWLQPIDPWLDFVDIGTFHPTAVDLCRVGGALLSVPRNVDARLLFARRSQVPAEWAPTSWADVLDVASTIGTGSGSGTEGPAGIAFPTRDSGLYGTCFELATAFGGGDGGWRTAVQWLVDAATLAAPAAMVAEAWYFDEVSAALRTGAVAMAGDWPGYYGLVRSQPGLRDELIVLRYPPGIDGRRYVYAGSHSWAIPANAPDPMGSATLLHHLTSVDAVTADAAAGMVPVRLDVAMPTDHPLDVRRAELLQLTMADDLLAFAPRADPRAIENAGAAHLRNALLGLADVDETTQRLRVIP